jgi:hypothetical protein
MKAGFLLDANVLFAMACPPTVLMRRSRNGSGDTRAKGGQPVP